MIRPIEQASAMRGQQEQIWKGEDKAKMESKWSPAQGLRNLIKTIQGDFIHDSARNFSVSFSKLFRLFSVSKNASNCLIRPLMDNGYVGLVDFVPCEQKVGMVEKSMQKVGHFLGQFLCQCGVVSTNGEKAYRLRILEIFRLDIIHIIGTKNQCDLIPPTLWGRVRQTVLYLCIFKPHFFQHLNRNLFAFNWSGSVASVVACFCGYMPVIGLGYRLLKNGHF